MSKPGLGVVMVLFLVLAIVLIWQQRDLQRVRGEAVSVREQLERAEAARLSAQHLLDEQKASLERGREADEQAKTNLAELLRLRGRVGMARQMEQENAQLTKPALQMYRDLQNATGLSDEEMASVGRLLPELHERIGAETAASVGLRGLQLLSTGRQEDLEQYLARFVGNYYQRYYTNGGDQLIERIDGAAKTNAAIAGAIPTRTQ